MYIAILYTYFSQVQASGAMLQEPFPRRTCSSWAILLGHADHKELGSERVEGRNTGSEE
jgi:hypothetical protein